MKKLLMLCALFVCGVPSHASAADFTFVIQNNHPFAVEVQIYSPIRRWVWPEVNRVWVNRSSQPERYTISCFAGEQVCYGAASGTFYWGVGLHGRYGCISCCHTCVDGGESVMMNLNPPPME